jgi:hypothetical protein
MKFAVFALSLFLFGCSADSGKEDEDSVLYDAAKEPLDKAEAAREAAEDAKAKVDAALEESEGDSDD